MGTYVMIDHQHSNFAILTYPYLRHEHPKLFIVAEPISREPTGRVTRELVYRIIA